MPDAGHNGSAHSYEVLGKLAEGGMTEIFLARAKGAGAVERFVVLKRLKRSVTTHVELVKLFLDEARLSAQLQHPNVAQVFEVGKLGGSYFFAMEFVNGETLQSLMLHARTRKIQIPVRAVLTIAAAVAAGLHHAHDRKGTDGQPLHIVHGEVSPTNVLVSQEGIVKLVDFGVAKAGEHGGSRISPYASPEQCIGSPLDRRSDLFSLGIVLWELLTLDGLYHRASDNDIAYAIATEEPPKPSAKRYDVPPELDAVILRLLAKDPAERFQDADELLAAIEALAQKLSILLSTADLSRMMRLWFGTKSEPAVDASAEPAAEPLVVNSEEIPDDLAIPVESPIDHQLETVRNAASLIITRATERARNTTGRPDKAPTVPPELMDNPNENFEQVRDRILARARQKKETMRNQIGVVSITQVPATEARSGSGDRHTRPTANAPLAAEEARKKPATTPPDARNGSNGHHVAADAARTSADGAVVSGELGGHAYDAKSYALTAAARIDAQMAAASADDDEDRGSTVADVPAPREAPPAVANVAAPASAAAITSSTSPVVAGETRGDARDVQLAAQASEAKPAVDADANAAREADAKAAREAEAARAAEAKAAREADAKTARDAERAARKAEREERAAAAERAARATSDAALRSDEDRDRADAIATARASTAEIMRRAPRRPVWMLATLGAASLLLVVLIIATLSGDDDEPSTKPSPGVASNTGSTNAAARPAGTTAHANHAGTAGAHGTSTAGTQPSTGTTNTGANTAVVNPSNTGGTNTAATGATTTGTNTTGMNTAATGATNTTTTNTATNAGTTSAGGATTGATGTNTATTGTGVSKTIERTNAVATTATNTTSKTDPNGSKTDTNGSKTDTNGSKTDTSTQAVTTGKKDTAETRQTTKKDAAETKKEPATKKGIDELFAAGEFAKTNTACTKEIVFTAQKLEMCAQAACQTSNTALAKRWINAISKASRPALIEKCKSLGVDVEAPAAPPAPAAP